MARTSKKVVNACDGLKARFEGPENAARYIETLMDSKLVNHDESLAIAISAVAELKGFETGADLIVQGERDDDLHLVLCGEVSIIVNNFTLYNRSPFDYVGEMAIIDSSVSRSATVRAVTPTVTAVLSRRQFETLATTYPKLWQCIAKGLSNKLRQRNSLIRESNLVPHCFIGCSVEKLDVAKAIQSGLKYDGVEARVWDQGVFGASAFPMESLMEQVQKADFAIFVVGAEDVVISGRKGNAKSAAPRDNIVFELGLFMGELGRDRTFMVKEEGLDTKIPSDLIGLTPITYQPGNDKDLTDISMRIGPACSELRDIIRKKKAR